ncbi:fibronectin type III domain-containing protein [Paenibacillus sp. 7516]|uniref:fibronectin type III domain-containing protein n=1 Tax=Paenibacillus sp. 7516 TaxID=2022549 RepID=UPI000BA74721|nr:fibronectin type III domain-containing protein [Paenibacillus sp. 7516]PAF30775.1 hypothetical protein CHI14_15935 [Paenibacillus sp. 7516]
MKKVFVLFLLMIMAVPVTPIFAAVGVSNIVVGKAPSLVTGEVTNVNAITDLQALSYAVLSPSSSVRYTFTQPYRASSFVIEVGASPAGLKLKLYDFYGNLLATGQPGGSLDKPYPIDDVSYVTLENTNAVGGASINVFDFKFNAAPMTDFTNPDAAKFMIVNLKATATNSTGTAISLTWDRIVSDYFKNYKVYQDNVLIQSPLVNSYMASGLVPGQTYNYKVSVVDTFGREFPAAAITYQVAEPDTVPPGKPTTVTVTPDRYSALVKWTAPLDNDVAGYRVYVDGELVNQTLVRNTQYTLTGLKHSTDYQVYVVAIDTSDNASEKSDVVDFKTLDLQSPPVNPRISGTAFSGGALLNWTPVPGADSYKVYQDGMLIQTTDSTSLRVSGLTNELSYNFYVVATNDVGDSEPSNTVMVTPSIKSVPEVSMSYKLKDVADSTSNWFSSYWTLLAFVIAIPLSFYVSNRIKGLF